MLRALTMKPGVLNKAAVMMILPLMVVALLLGTRATGGTASQPAEAPREGMLVVANLRGSSLTLHDLGGDGQARTLVLPAGPHEFVEANGRLYATLTLADQLVEIDPEAPGILRSIGLPGAPHGLAVDASGRLLVTLDDENAVVTIDPLTLREIGRVATGNTPHAVAVVGNETYVTDSRDARVRELESGATANTRLLPESVVVAGEFVVTADAQGGALSIFERGTLEPVGTVEVGGGPVRVLTLDETHVVASLNANARAVVVDLDSLEIERRLRVPDRPDGLCLSPSRRYLAVASNAEDLVQVYRTSDWKLMVTLAAGDGPGACLWLE